MGELIEGVFQIDELSKWVRESPIDNLLIAGGLVFLVIAVVGKIRGKIEPGKAGRIASGVFGSILVAVGLVIHLNHPSPATDRAKPTPVSTLGPSRARPKPFKLLDSARIALWRTGSGQVPFGGQPGRREAGGAFETRQVTLDRKSTRLNSSHRL